MSISPIRSAAKSEFPVPIDERRDAFLARRNRLVEDYWPLVRSMAAALAKNVPPAWTMEDLAQAGATGLISAATRYRGGPVHFSVFAKQFVRGAMIESIRRRHWRENTMEELPARHDVAVITARETSLDRARRSESLRRAVASLPLRERRVMEARLHASEPSIPEVARMVARKTKKKRMTDGEAARLIQSATLRLKLQLAPLPDAA